MRCPDCNTKLVSSILDANYFLCPSKSCTISKHVMWSEIGAVYATSETGNSWVVNNAQYATDPGTWKNSGVVAKDSSAEKMMKELIERKNTWLFRLRHWARKNSYCYHVPHKKLKTTNFLKYKLAILLNRMLK